MTEGKNHTTQRMNIEAVKRIVETVSTTLGPMGMDKMMVDGGGNVIVTNDGATILRELDSAHPAAKMIVEVSKMQETNCYDGTTSTVVLAGQLLSNAEALFERGLHPNVIKKGYMRASEISIELLKEAIVEGEINLKDIARTAITGKSLESSEDKVATLCVSTIEHVGDTKDVRVLAAPGGSLNDSYLFRGVVVGKDFVGKVDWPKEKSVPILLLNSGLETQKDAPNMQVQVDAASYSAVKNADRDSLLDAAKAIIKSGAEVVASRDGIHDTAVTYLRKNGVAVLRRVPESIMTALQNELGGDIYGTPEKNMIANEGVIERAVFNDVSYLFIKKHEKEATLILFGATQSTLDEVQRGFDDALGVVSLVRNGDSVCYGGGVAYLAISMGLRAQASSIGGRAQMAIEAFADALEMLPATIAENAGHDALDTVLAMRHAHQNGGKDMGPDVENGGIISMGDLGVYEPLSLIKNAITGAAEVASAILRIDNVIGRRNSE